MLGEMRLGDSVREAGAARPDAGSDGGPRVAASAFTGSLVLARTRTARAGHGSEVLALLTKLRPESDSTVRRDTPRRFAISGLVYPTAISCSTSRSRFIRWWSVVRWWSARSPFSADSLPRLRSYSNARSSAWAARRETRSESVHLFGLKGLRACPREPGCTQRIVIGGTQGHRGSCRERCCERVSEQVGIAFADRLGGAEQDRPPSLNRLTQWGLGTQWEFDPTGGDVRI